MKRNLDVRLLLLVFSVSFVAAQTRSWVHEAGYIQTKVIEDGFILKLSSVDQNLPLEIRRDKDGIHEIDRDLDAVYLVATADAAVLDDWGSVSFNARAGLLDVEVGGRRLRWNAGRGGAGYSAASIIRYESPSVEDIYASDPHATQPLLPIEECEVGGRGSDYCGIDCGGGTPQACSIHCNSLSYACCNCLISASGVPRRAKCVCKASSGSVP